MVAVALELPVALERRAELALLELPALRALAVQEALESKLPCGVRRSRRCVDSCRRWSSAVTLPPLTRRAA